jgi:hypothetical protein
MLLKCYLVLLITKLLDVIDVWMDNIHLLCILSKLRVIGLVLIGIPG